jgi:DNA repair protein RecO (recombination protein O)
MPSEKTRAIVLKVVEFSETSCILTLFTEDFGKVGALAKGARRPKSAFEGALDLLALVRIVFLRKSSDALDLLTEARLERRFRAAQRELSRLYAGYYVAELLNELTDTGDPHPGLFAVADQTLLNLDEGRSVQGSILHFELAALRHAGHMPSLDDCAACGREVAMHTESHEKSSRIAFGMTAGGVLCESCKFGKRSVVSVRRSVIAALRAAALAVEDSISPANGAENFAVPSGGNLLPLDESIWGELRAVMGNYFAHLTGHRLKMSSYLANPTG